MWKRFWKRASRWIAKSRKPQQPLDEQKMLSEKLAESDSDQQPDEPEIRIDSAPDPQPETTQLPELEPSDSQPEPQFPTISETARQDDSLPRPETSQRSEPSTTLTSPMGNIPGEAPLLPKAESFNFYDPPASSEAKPEPPPDTAAQIERIFASSENDDLPPLTNKVRVPPELAGQELPPPPPGLELAGPQADRPAALPQQETSQQDKPMTSQQGEQLIRIVGEQTRVLEDIKTGQATVATAIENLAVSLQNSGGVV